MTDPVTISEVRTATGRRDWMDVLRGIAVALVVVAHAIRITEFAGQYSFPGLEEAVQIMTPLRIPLLFILSGLLVPRSLAKGSWRYLKGKLTHVLYPYVLWTILLGLVTIVIGGTFLFPDFLSDLVQPATHLWFLGYLFCYYVLAILCRWVHPLVIATAALALAALPIDGQWDRFWERAIPFFVGIAIGHSIDGFERFVRQRVLCWVLFLGATAAMVGQVLWNWGTPDPLRQSVIAVAFFVGVSGLILPIAHLRGLRPLRYVGKRTIKLYILHWSFIELTIWQLSTRTDLGPRALLLIAVFVGFVPPILVMLLADRFRAVDWLFEWNPRRKRPVSDAGDTGNAPEVDDPEGRTTPR